MSPKWLQIVAQKVIKTPNLVTLRREASRNERGLITKLSRGESISGGDVDDDDDDDNDDDDNDDNDDNDDERGKI